MSKVLSDRVLVLNSNWAAFDIWSLEHAITKLFNTDDDGTSKARIVNVEDFTLMEWADWAELRPEDGDKSISTSTTDYKVPEVIVLTGYNKYPKPRLNFSRKALYRLYKYTCQYCDKKFPTDTLTIDHVLPRAQGGKTSWENCVLSCIGCNSHKANRTPAQANMKLVCGEPRKPTSKLFDVGKISCKSWQKFMDAVYWETDIGDD